MYEDIEKPVKVTCAFDKLKVIPIFLQVGEKVVRIKETTMNNKMYRGSETIYFISASNDTACYFLRFESANLKWVLEKVWYKM